ncbi:phosphoenolpyruvate synthase [Desulforamulus aeronauticus]|uniref:Phosphoenolpyruvate synthase n=1 Tax=Desulforamulus aeronauticus DSM 10349 TaxID=1121421 RepID=A0A1M6QAF6_9FIRM|nr:phosphoenolpyruvate synthase [Desulforamulus aeronauticus]SHK17146.1 phosphoenolpyruvate synthase [Desulforamulus aeronauticus DSM 10349]
MSMLLHLTDSAAGELSLTGGKGANLSRLAAMDGVHVPGGFVVTTEAFRALCAGVVASRSEALRATSIPVGLARAGDEIRQAIRDIPIPEEFLRELKAALASYPPDILFAVRSSATAEDLPDASFAGQQDSYLNVRAADVPRAGMDCFASLYNDRAVAYRVKNGYRHEDVAIAVVVQEMVHAQVSGVLFTADPMTSDRLTCVIEAVEGLGEELVSGRKTPFTWRLRGENIKTDSKAAPPLTDSRLRELAAIGKRIEAAFGAPQDIEWCWVDGRFSIVQSRAITTLYPLPESHDGLKRVFVSAGHMQMMTDVMLPLGMSFMKLIALLRMEEVGGRLYIDVTHDTKSAYGKKMIRTKLSATDPLTNQAIEEVLARKDYIRGIPKGPGSFSSFGGWLPILREGIRLYRHNDPADIDCYIERMRDLVARLEERLEPLSGMAAIEAILEDQKQLSQIIYDASGFGMVLATQFIIQKIDDMGKALTGEEHISNRLSKSVEHNPTSEMGLALSEVADLARTYPAVVGYLEAAGEVFRMEDLRQVEGGGAVADAFEKFLRQYGMRATGEIDISKTRFRENPAELVATVLTNIRTLPKGHGKSSFEQGRREMEALIEELSALAQQKLGARKAKKLRRYISFFRNYVGTREYPKYFWICRYDIYKKALMREAKRLTEQGVLREPGDIFYLYLEELREAVRTGRVDYATIDRRKKDYAHFATLTPPRVIFSDGEVPEMTYQKDIPTGALPGLGVSSGVVEGRARVVGSIEDAVMEKGDILVTSFTDPSWTPVFVSIAGLVTEVGGMMTHGAVITREYGLPAVVGVVGATRRIRDGDRIRINGDEGYVEIL